jgi:hypothetical protein
MKPETIKIDEVEYVRKDAQNAPSKPLDGKEYVVIRSKDSGCHAGYLESEDGTTITLINSRRLWYWSGAASLSQLAMEGVSNPKDCKFPCAVDSITVYSVCEKISTTAKAQSSIEGVEVWKA